MEKEEKALVLDDAERLLTLEEVGERLGTGRQFIVRLIRAGFLQALSFRKTRRVPKSELARFVHAHLGEDLYEVLDAAEAQLA